MPEEIENQPSQTNIDSASENGTPWYASDGVDQSLVSDKVKSFGDLNALLKSYNEAQSYIGGAVKIPGESASDEEKAAFYRKLGRPDTPEQYDWKTPEGFEVIEDNFKAFKKACHGLGMTNGQVSGVMNAWLEAVREIEAKQAAEFEDLQKSNLAALSAPDVWGDKAREKIGAVQKRLEAFDGGRAAEKLRARGLMDDADILKLVDSIMAEASDSRMAGKDGKSGLSASEEIAALKASPAYLNASHPEHTATVRRFNELVDGK